MDFTADINTNGIQAKYNPPSDLVSDVAGGIVATAVDFGASVWNSLPGTEEVDTGELLRGINDNAFRVYNENPDTIRTASFIGGMFLPAGIALKGMKLARSGAKGINWFSEAGRTEDLARVAAAFKESGSASAAYRSATRSLYAKTAVNQAIDTVAAEAAIVFSMNAHPFMEDYMEDPAKNFAISLAVGGTIGAGIGHIADRFAVRSLTGKIETSWLKEIGENVSAVPESYPGISQIQVHGINVKNLDEIIRKAGEQGKTTLNDGMVNWADARRKQEVISKQQAFDEVLDPEIKALPLQAKLQIQEGIENAPEMHGVNSIRWLTDVEAQGRMSLKPKVSSVSDTPKLFDIFKNKKTGVTSEREIKSVYYQTVGGYAPLSAARHYAPGVTLVNSEKAAIKFVGKDAHVAPRMDYGFDMIGKASAELEADQIGNIFKFTNMDAKTFEKAFVSVTDTSSLQGALAAMRANPELAAKGIRIHDVNLQAKLAMEAKVVSVGPAPKKYADQLYNIVNTQTIGRANHINVLRDSTVSDNAKAFIKGWIGGNTYPLQEGAMQYFSKGYTAMSLQTKNLTKIGEARKYVQEIYESNASKNLRDQLRKIADPDGNIYLYRGLNKSKLNGQMPLESMTTDFTKALEFATNSEDGRVNLYRVPVDDVVATWEDIAGASDNLTEILVASSARVPVSSLNKAGREMLPAGIPAGFKPVTQQPLPNKMAGINEVANMLKIQKAENIDNYAALGYPAASIAIKTNTPVQVVEAYMTGATKGVGALEDVLRNTAQQIPDMDPVTGSYIFSRETAEAALDPLKKPLVLSGSLLKNRFTDAVSRLDAKNLRDINKQFTSLALAGSKSSFAQKLGDWFAENSAFVDVAEAEVGKANNANASSRFFSSSDMYTRLMGPIGLFANTMGKFVTKEQNALIGRVVEPIKVAMEAVSKDSAAVVELTNTFNLLDSLKGWRQFDPATGKIMQKTWQTTPNGSRVEVLVPVKVPGSTFAPTPMANGIDYVVNTPSVRKALEAMQLQSKDLKFLPDTINKILGKKESGDIGFWKPTFNPVNKHIAYVHNTLTDETSLIAYADKNTYNEVVREYKQMLVGSGKTEIQVFEKGSDQQMWSILNGRNDAIHMTHADVSMTKAGKAASAIPTQQLAVFGELIGGYEHYISSQVRNLVDVSLPDMMYALNAMSKKYNDGWEEMAKDVTTAGLKKPKNAAATLRNIMLGQDGVNEYQGWKTLNQSFETMIRFGTDTVSSAWKAATDPLRNTRFGGKRELEAEALNKLDYEKFAQGLAYRGIHNPFAAFDEEAAKMYGLSKLEDSKDISKRLVYGGNALAATLALRVGDLAQPLVNIMSMPIMMHLAASAKMPEHFLGKRLGTAKVQNGVQVMYEGVRAMNSPKFKNLAQKWEAAGYFDPMISEANDTLLKTRAFDKDAIAATERAVNSSMVKLLSKPADWSEAFSRKLTMFTGAALAKRLYPELDDAGITIFARDFMDKAIGNFHAAQRPVLFQGTAGVALGLFQTYALTLAQNMYRHLEMKSYKEIGKAMLAQSALFGTSSVPGFKQISDLIGEEFSDDHVDLTTGTFRAASDPIAETILYGLPSQIGLGTHTRGDANFRFPGVDGIVAVNFATQIGKSVMDVANAVGNADASVPQAFAEALSLQSISRPLARGAELVMDYSVTRDAGTNVQVPEEVWTLSGVLARVLSTRPFEEVKLREAMHLNSFYGSVDYENRQSLMNSLRSKLRGGTLNETDIAEGAETYLRNGGTPTGWRSAYRTLLAQEDYTGKEILAKKLRMDSPLNYMIDSLDGY